MMFMGMLFGGGFDGIGDGIGAIGEGLGEGIGSIGDGIGGDVRRHRRHVRRVRLLIDRRSRLLVTCR